MSTSIVSIDFESRSATDIKLGVERYSKDPECEALMLAFRMPDMAVPVVSHRGPHLSDDWCRRQELEQLLDHVASGGRIRAWNAMFECNIWNNVCVPKYGWPPLKLEQCVDTMAQAAAMNLPQALGKCAEVLGLPADQQKDKRGKYLIQRLCVPHPPTLKRAGKWVEDEKLFAEFVSYNAQDVVTEEAVAAKLRPLSDFEQEVWLLTQRMNLRGVPVALDEAKNIRDLVEAEKERLNRELRGITGRRVLRATDRNGLLTWVNEQHGLAEPVTFDEEKDSDDLMPDMTGDTVESVLKRTDLTPQVRRALEIRAAVCQTSTAKYDRILKIVADDGTMKNLFVYHGAGPGRWASRGGFNVQNIARPTLMVNEKKGLDDIANAHEILGSGDHEAAILLWGDDVMDAAVSCIRGVLKAKPGHDFIDADYANVEVRVAAWLSGQHGLVEAFRGGLDPYKMYAVDLFKVPYDKVTKDQRQFSKAPILGGIFGLGGAGLVDYATQYGVTMTLEQGEQAVALLRKKWSKIRDSWYACGDASIKATQNPGEWFKAGEKLALKVHKNFLWMRLPSGRVIAWSSPRVEIQDAPWFEDFYNPETGATEKRKARRPVVTVESVDTYTRKFCRHKLIGSSIYQSAVQGTARDILAQGAMNVEAAGYPIVLMAHDELLAHVPEGFGSEEEFGRLMCKPADWYADLPLSYEAYRSRRFKK
jgi:DNA polymerase